LAYRAATVPGRLERVPHNAAIRPEPAHRAEGRVGREQIQRADCIQLAGRVGGVELC